MSMIIIWEKREQKKLGWYSQNVLRYSYDHA
jgi:hypothetical protein